ncbi:unnamed protein product [Amoebophrya sp. A25]|nr:unnamed protein product [Amoebophrya sp. A25]|eukprot:GSA25T00017506001.1
MLTDMAASAKKTERDLILDKLEGKTREEDLLLDRQAMYPQSELRLHLLVKCSEPSQVAIVRRQLKSVLSYLENTTSNDARVHDVFMGSNGDPERHPFFGLVPLKYVYSSEHPVREARREWRFNLPSELAAAGQQSHDGSSGDDVVALFQKWQTNFAGEITKHKNELQRVKESLTDAAYNIDLEILDRDLHPLGEELKKDSARGSDPENPQDGSSTGINKDAAKESHGGKKLEDVQASDGEVVQDSSAAAGKKRNAEEAAEKAGESKNTPSKKRRRLSMLGKEATVPLEQQKSVLLKKVPNISRTDWFGLPEVKREGSKAILQIPGLAPPETTQVSTDVTKFVMQKFQELLADWDRPYWWEPRELLGTQGLAHGPLARVERKLKASDRHLALASEIARETGTSTAHQLQAVFGTEGLSGTTLQNRDSTSTSEAIGSTSSLPMPLSKASSLSTAAAVERPGGALSTAAPSLVPKIPGLGGLTLGQAPPLGPSSLSSGAFAGTADDFGDKDEKDAEEESGVVFEQGNYAYAAADPLRPSCFANPFLVGQQVALSDAAADHFADLLYQSGLCDPSEANAATASATAAVPPASSPASSPLDSGSESARKLDLPDTLSKEEIATALRAARGVVRCLKKDEELLVYLKYPWAPYSDLHKQIRTHYPAPQPDVHRERPVEVLCHDEEEGRKASASPNRGPKNRTGRSGSAASSPARFAVAAQHLETKKRKTKLCYYGYLVDWRLPCPAREQELFKEEQGALDTRALAAISSADGRGAMEVGPIKSSPRTGPMPQGAMSARKGKGPVVPGAKMHPGPYAVPGMGPPMLGPAGGPLVVDIGYGGPIAPGGAMIAGAPPGAVLAPGIVTPAGSPPAGSPLVPGTAGGLLAHAGVHPSVPLGSPGAGQMTGILGGKGIAQGVNAAQPEAAGAPPSSSSAVDLLGGGPESPPASALDRAMGVKSTGVPGTSQLLQHSSMQQPPPTVAKASTGAGGVLAAPKAEAPLLQVVDREKSLATTGITARLVESGTANNLVVVEQDPSRPSPREQEMTAAAAVAAAAEEKRRKEQEEQERKKKEAEDEKRKQAEVAALALQAINPNAKPSASFSTPEASAQNNQPQQSPRDSGAFSAIEQQLAAISRFLPDEQKTELKNTMLAITKGKGKKQQLQDAGLQGTDKGQQLQETIMQGIMKLRSLKGAAIQRMQEMQAAKGQQQVQNAMGAKGLRPAEQQQASAPSAPAAPQLTLAQQIAAMSLASSANSSSSAPAAASSSSGPQMSLVRDLGPSGDDARLAALAAAQKEAQQSVTGSVLNFGRRADPLEGPSIGAGASSSSSSGASKPPQQLAPPQQLNPIPTSSVPDRLQFQGAVFLPPEVFPTPDLQGKIAGPGNEYFNHVLARFPNTKIEFNGLPTAQAPPDKRLHVVVSSRNPDVRAFKNAFKNVIDLAETVSENVANEHLKLSEAQAKEISKQVRSEMFAIGPDGTSRRIEDADDRSDDEDTVESDATVQDEETPLGGGGEPAGFGNPMMKGGKKGKGKGGSMNPKGGKNW